MREKLPLMRTIFIGALAGGLMVSCSQKTAYNGASSQNLAAAQQYYSPKAENQEIKKNDISLLETENVVKKEASQIINPEKPEAMQQKIMKTKKLLQDAKKEVKLAINTNIDRLQNSATMQVKADGDGSALLTVGLLFLMLGVLGFIIPPLFFIGLNAVSASMLVIVTVGVAAFGLLLMAFGVAKNNEKS